KGVDDVRLTTTLPDEILSGDCLFIKTGKDLDAYVDGELRNSYRISRSVFGRTVNGMWLPITLRESDGGKTLTLIRPGYWLDEYVLGEVMIGNRLGFAVRLIHDNLFILILGFAIITFVLVITAICLVYRIRNRRSFPVLIKRQSPDRISSGSVVVSLTSSTPFTLNTAGAAYCAVTPSGSVYVHTASYSSHLSP
ncbi:MAG: hypothetical protein IJT00_09665, partial [Lachnospiraceae bacterium]|nr:hypothetical protein [Lachnospiraceae bacterium]